jgi:hypothetical protein
MGSYTGEIGFPGSANGPGRPGYGAPMKLIGGAAALAVICTLLAGCGGGQDDAGSSSPTKTVTETVTKTVSPKPVPAVTATKVGSTYATKFVKVTVFDYRRAVPNPYGKKPGQRLDSVLVRTCAVKKSTLSWDPWSLETPDSSSYPAASESYDSWPRPQYPFAGERTFAPGECVKGWIEFYVNNGVKVHEIVYSPSDGSHRWRV